MKKCNMCKLDKDESEFYKNATTKDGLEYQCKECRKKLSKQYYKDNKDKVDSRIKNWHDNNVEKMEEYRKHWREENKERIREYDKQWRKNNQR
jgi:hypothetical protein